jgi:uncharacterized protein YukE
MHQAEKGAVMAKLQSDADGIAEVRRALTRLAAELGEVAAPTEPVFVELGQALAATVAGLQRIGTDFADLSQQIDGEDAVAAVDGIEQAVACIANLSVDRGQEAACLVQLTGDVGQLARRLVILRSVAGEVGVLAMNAKIQASQLRVGGDDFSVFTTEMTRLAGLAQATVERAATKVAQLAAAIGTAHADREAFVRDSGAELATVGQRLSEGAATLAERRRRAVAAVETVRERSSRSAEHVSGGIQQLQVNDITIQRIDHVRKALEALDAVLASDGSDPADGPPLAAAACRLQQAQLERTAIEYVEQVEQLAANLRGIAAEARGVVDEAAAAFSDGGQVSFAGHLEADIGRANRLLDGFAAARDRVQAVMEAVHDGAAEVVQDLHAIASIDADMQVMGLNATLKCGRLGTEGRALGVIAHELRSCSKRTEDNARGIGSLLQNITDVAARLHQAGDGEGISHLTDLQEAVTASLGRLQALARLMDSALGSLERDGRQAIVALEATAADIAVHHQLSAALNAIARRLEELSADWGGGEGDVDAIRERLRSLLADHYTMASERIVHQLIADDDEILAESAPADTDVDDFFL